jgi:predicted ATP-dependent endonuclease of OLD family
MNIIIGNNGVGKSAILEGLDTFFNDAPWIINNDIRGKKEDVSVGVIMLVQKSSVEKKLDTKEKQMLNDISEMFWTIDNNNSMLRYYPEFVQLRNSVIGHRNDCYLFIAGREYEERDIMFLSFSSMVMSSVTLIPKPTEQAISKLMEKVLAFFTFIYIPVETSISDFVKLQNQSMQTLTDSNVKESISSRLKEKFIIRTTPSGKKENRSLLDYVNDSLERYVRNVEEDIQKIYPGYSYKPGPRQASKLTANHITDAIVTAYYSRRSFKKDGKDIQNLSSGEKRIILIDIISAFIKKDSPDRELIIGIDEPENSLHVSKCYSQFQKIEEISVNYGHQLFITTHWYGSLPSLSKGSLIHIDDKGKPSIFNISNYFEDRGGLPDDIQLKGYFDLTTSLLYSFRNSNKNWLLVEGYDDKKYISYHLQDNNVQIIPLGGCGNVKKMYEYLYIPMSTKEFKKSGNKVVCLIDTDVTCSPISVKSGDDKDALIIRRLHEQEDGVVTLLRIDAPDRKETEIEEILNPKQFYDSLLKVITEKGDVEDMKAFSTFDFDTRATNSRIRGDHGILKLNTLDRDALEDKERVLSFVNAHKDDIADEYISVKYKGAELSWVSKLKELL